MLKQGFSHFAVYVAPIVKLSARAQRFGIIVMLVLIALLLNLNGFDGIFTFVFACIALMLAAFGWKNLLNLTSTRGKEEAAKHELWQEIFIILALGLGIFGVILFGTGMLGFANGNAHSILLLPVGVVTMLAGVVFSILSYNVDPG